VENVTAQQGVIGWGGGTKGENELDNATSRKGTRGERKGLKVKGGKGLPRVSGNGGIGVGKN